jgi:hypothetical protein
MGVLTSCGDTAGRVQPIPETGATLTGTVAFRKESVRIGTVIVAGSSGATGDIGEDGRYTVHNVPLGEVTVAINMGPARGKLLGMAATAKANGDKTPLPKIPDIPGKYTDPAQSPLKTTINKGDNTFNIVIE